MFEPRDDRLLFAGREKFGSRRRQQVVTTLDERLVLLDAQAHAGVEFAEFLIDLGQ